MTRRLLPQLFTVSVLLAAAGSGMAQQRATTAETDYVLDPGDVIRVTDFRSFELTLETLITETSFGNCPLLGAVSLGGQTVSAAKKRPADGLLAGKIEEQLQESILVVTQSGKQVDSRSLFRGGNPADYWAIQHSLVGYIERMPPIHVYGKVQKRGLQETQQQHEQDDVIFVRESHFL